MRLLIKPETKSCTGLMLMLRLDDSQATQKENDHFKAGESKSENEKPSKDGPY